MPVGELLPRLLDFVELVTQAETEPAEEPADARATDRLVEVGHILRGDDLDLVRRKAGVREGGDHAVRLIAVDGRGYLMEGERPMTRSARGRRAALRFIIHLRLRSAFSR